MIETLSLLENSNFPAINRSNLTTLQVNLGYVCNQQCLHCHVNAGPKRTETMSRDNIDQVLRFLQASEVNLLDLTGGAPELNVNFRYLVEKTRSLGVTKPHKMTWPLSWQPSKWKLPLLCPVTWKKTSTNNEARESSMAVCLD